jgi:hypothetical protein
VADGSFGLTLLLFFLGLGFVIYKVMQQKAPWGFSRGAFTSTSKVNISYHPMGSDRLAPIFSVTYP